jgi:hypothetical protein
MLIEWYLLIPLLSERIYWVFLVEMPPELLEEIPLALRRNMWLQHVGAAAHFVR